jgi:hypothetical protein
VVISIPGKGVFILGNGRASIPKHEEQHPAKEKAHKANILKLLLFYFPEVG